MDQSASDQQQQPMEEGNQANDKERANADEANTEAPAAAEKKSSKKPKKTVKTIDLPVEASVHQMSQLQLNSLVEKENEMVRQDSCEKERADAKNEVEEYVYEMRDKLYSTYEEFVKEEDRDAFSIVLENTETWLYDEGEDQEKQVYIDKLAELKKTGQPVADRYREAQDWPIARDEMGTIIQQIHKFLDMWKQKDEKYDHIEQADIDKIEKLLGEKSTWFNNRLTQMAKLKKFENPVVLASQVRHEKKILEATAIPIMNKPKPKVEPPKEEKAPEKGDSVQNEADAQKTQEQQAPVDSQKETTEQMDVD